MFRLFPALAVTALLLIVLGLFACTPADAANAPRVGIAATVNDDVITMGDLDNRVQLYLGGAPGKPSPAELAKIQKDVLGRLIDEKLQMQEAKSLSIEVADEQIAQGFTEIARQNKTTPEIFRDRLENAGVNVDTLRDQIRSEIAWAQVVRRKLRPQVNVSEHEIDTALEQRVSRQGKTEYHLAEIFLATDGTEKDRDVANEANAIHAALKKGARFSEIARQRSQSPGASTGGDIGWITQDQIDPELAPHVTNMQSGQVTPPIKTKTGYYIVFLRDLRRNDGSDAVAQAPATPAPVITDTEAVLMLKQLTIPVAADEPQPVMAAKFARAQTLSAQAKDCAALDTLAAEFKTKTASGPQKMSTLPPAIAKILTDLQDSQLSQPIRTTNGISVFMICSRETPAAPAGAEVAVTAPPATPGTAPAPGTSSEDEVRDQIASEIGGDRLVQMQERYLRDLRATAFIERRI